MRPLRVPCAAYIVSLALSACGGSGPAPAQSPSPTASGSAASSAAPADDATAKRAEAARGRAREIAAAAVTWRRAHSGTCPTTKDVLDKYAFAPGTELDAAGAPFTIECGDAEIRIVASSHEIAHVEPYSAQAPPSPPLNDPPPSATNSPAVGNMDDVVAGLNPVRMRVRACYNNALKNNPSLSGVVHGKFVIGPNGTVKDVIFDKSTTIRDPAFLACVKNATQNVTFPATGSEATISF